MDMPIHTQAVLVTILLASYMVSCGTYTAPITPEPIPSTKVQFFADQVDLDGIQWMEHQAIEYGARLELTGCFALNKDVAFLFGGLSVPAGTIRSVVLRTEDSGRNWREVMKPVVGSVVRQIAFGNAGKGWALVMWSVEGPGTVVLYYTTDYGQTWDKLSDVPKWAWYSYPIQMKFSDESNGQIYMVYDVGLPEDNRIAILTTSDGGLTWKETDHLTSGPQNLRDMATAIAPYRQYLYESVGRDRSSWKLEPGEWGTAQITISRRLTAENDWSVVSAISKQLKYIGGRISSP